MNASAIGLFLETVLKSIIFPWSLVHDYTAVSTLFFGNNLYAKMFIILTQSYPLS